MQKYSFLIAGIILLAAGPNWNANGQNRKSAYALTAGDLIVCRVGDGQRPLGNGATPVFLDEFTPAGVLFRSIALPTAVSGNNKRLTVEGSSSSECQIMRSADGQYILLAGYDAAVGTLNLAASPAATNARVIARIDASGSVDTTTALSDAISEGSVRGAASTNGIDLWISGNGTGGHTSGLRYAAFGSTISTALLPNSTNLRAVNIFGGQLFASSGSGSIRMAAVGSGTPITSGQSLNALPGVPTNISLNSFFFADLSPSIAGVDTLYAADDAAGMIRKYSFNGTNWIANGSTAFPAVTGLAGVVNGTAVTLYATSPSSLRTMTDSSGHNAAITGTLSVIASPLANTEFRSVALAPASISTLNVSWGMGGFMRRAALTAGNNGSGVRRIYFKLPNADAFQYVEGTSARIKVIRQAGSWSFQAFVEDNAGNRSDVVTYSIR